MKEMAKIGLGGGCHWCTEAVFQQLKGVLCVQQGYINSTGKENFFSEGVIVHFNPDLISLQDLVNIHVHTHRATSDHSFRDKYRSAVYYFDPDQISETEKALAISQKEFTEKIITRILPFQTFKPSRESIRDYFQKNRNAPFCERYIVPKLKLLEDNFPDQLN